MMNGLNSFILDALIANASRTNTAKNPLGSTAERTREFILSTAAEDAEARQARDMERMLNPFDGALVKEEENNETDEDKQEAEKSATKTQLDTLQAERDQIAKDNWEYYANRMETLAKENVMRTRELGLANVANNISSRVNSLFTLSQYYARRNQQDDAVSMVLSALPIVNEGLSSLKGSDAANISSSFLSSLQGFYTGLESAVNDWQQKTKGIAPTDEELLALTGKDSKGRTALENRLDRLANYSLSNTPLRDIQAELASLSEPYRSQLDLDLA